MLLEQHIHTDGEVPGMKSTPVLASTRLEQLVFLNPVLGHVKCWRTERLATRQITGRLHQPTLVDSTPWLIAEIWRGGGGQ